MGFNVGDVEGFTEGTSVVKEMRNYTTPFTFCHDF